MRIYNLLFYASYKVMQKSGNFNGTPVLGGVLFVVLCLSFNIYSVLFVLLGLDILHTDFSEERYDFLDVVFGIMMIGFLLFYYKYKNRYKTIVKRYDDKKTLNSWLIILIYYAVSTLMMFITATFMHRDWIFRNIL